MAAPTLVVIPTFNERESVTAVVSRVRSAAPDVDILIVDDNSPDGTGAIADALAASDPALHVLHRTGKAGLGSAYNAAFRWGLDRGYTRLVEMDADGSHQPEQLPSLLAAADSGADVVLGSRWVHGGSVENWPTYRKLLSRGGSAYSRLALGLPQRDVTGGYRVLTAHALESIRLDDVHSQGYGFQVDLLFHAHRAGLRIVEVPITFIERELGTSKMTGGIVAEAMLRVTLWGIGALPGRVRRKLRRG
ncbi:dolichol-phosphate mannosyltransferase [Mycetocola sp. CAN_C7]|uniref:polyprenol monophosphomannose synthase n=1 Tax=Mycetocola sp. CAN_C7 TaxID=2787724 RepID=UPI0018C938B9